jgi:hypothetical protein
MPGCQVFAAEGFEEGELERSWIERLSGQS